MLALTAPGSTGAGHEHRPGCDSGHAARLVARRLTCVNSGIGPKIENVFKERAAKAENSMAIGEICSREVVYLRRGENIRTAAELMRQHHVGSLVVVDNGEAGCAPVGIITDRDIVVAVVALGLDPKSIRAEDLMSPELATVGESAGVAETAELMRAKGLRRLPVTDSRGVLVGIVAADDLLSLLAEELSALATMISRQHRREAEVRKAIA